MPEEFKCPIGLDKIHCQNCYFSKEGLCDHPHSFTDKCEQKYCFLPKGHEGLHQAVARVYDIQGGLTG